MDALASSPCEHEETYRRAKACEESGNKPRLLGAEAILHCEIVSNCSSERIWETNRYQG